MALSPAVRDLPSFRRWAQAALPRGLAFLGPDPHHALGFLDLVPRLFIAAADRPPALAAAEALGARCWRPVGADNAAEQGARAGGDDTAAEVLRDSAGLAAEPEFLPWLADCGGGEAPPVVVFKPSHRLEALAAEAGWRLLAAPAGLARQWENKVAFRAKAEALGLKQPPGRVLGPEDTFAATATQLGLPFVLQAPHGYSGARTLLVADEAAFGEARAALRSPRLRATAWIEGRPLTLNACVTGQGVAMAAPCLQVTGEPGLTRHPLGSCGNDWSWPGLRGLDLVPFRRATQAIGGALAQAGFRGFFGLDFVLDPASSQPWLIEVNPRLVASASLHAQLELLAGRLPLAARHLLALLDPAADELPLDAHEEPLEGSQLILHNLDVRSRRWEQPLAAGPLMVSGMAGTQDAASSSSGSDRAEACLLRQLKADDALLLPPPPGRQVGSGSEWGRLQSRQGLTDEAGRPQAATGALLAQLLEGAGWPSRIVSDDASALRDFV